MIIRGRLIFEIFDCRRGWCDGRSRSGVICRLRRASGRRNAQSCSRRFRQPIAYTGVLAIDLLPMRYEDWMFREAGVRLPTSRIASGARTGKPARPRHSASSSEGSSHRSSGCKGSAPVTRRAKKQVASERAFPRTQWTWSNGRPGKSVAGDLPLLLRFARKRSLQRGARGGKTWRRGTDPIGG